MNNSVDINFNDYIDENNFENKNEQKKVEKSIEKTMIKKKKEAEKNISIIDKEIKDILLNISKKEENIELILNELNKKNDNSSLTKINDEIDNLVSKIKETEIYLITLKKETAENIKLLEEQITNNTVSRMEIMYKSLNNIIKSLNDLNNALNSNDKFEEKENKKNYKKLLVYSFIFSIFLIGYIFLKLNLKN